MDALHTPQDHTRLERDSSSSAYDSIWQTSISAHMQIYPSCGSLVASASDCSTPTRSPPRRPRTRYHPPGYIPRPRNAFIFFRSDFNDTLQRQLSEDSGRNGQTLHQSNISVEVGKAWRALSAEEKEPYYALQDREKRTHKLKYPDYHYACNAKQPVGSTKRRRKARPTTIDLAELIPSSGKGDEYDSTAPSTFEVPSPSPSTSSSISLLSELELSNGGLLPPPMDEISDFQVPDASLLYSHIAVTGRSLEVPTSLSTNGDFLSPFTLNAGPLDKRPSIAFNFDLGPGWDSVTMEALYTAPLDWGSPVWEYQHPPEERYIQDASTSQFANFTV